MRSLGLLLTALLTALLTLTACGSGSEPERPTEPTKSVDERGTRSDLDPLTSRFPDLGDPVSATWQSGTLGDDRTAPGPSTYWIDAVITVEPTVADELRSHPTTTGAQSPDLVEPIREAMGDGDYDKVIVSGPDMWQVDAWVSPDRDLVVISARGQ